MKHESRQFSSNTPLDSASDSTTVRTSEPIGEVEELERRLREAHREIELRDRELQELKVRMAGARSPEREAQHSPIYSDSPTMVVTVDTEGKILTINTACASHLGYTKEELRGESVLQIYYEPDRRSCRELLRRCLDDPQQVQRRQFRKMRKDGTIVWVEETAQALCDLRGTQGVQIVCQDVTAQKVAAEEREQLLVQLDAVLNSINDGVVIADLQGTVLSMNPAALAMHEMDSLEEARRQLHHFGEIFELREFDGRPLPLDEWPLARALRGIRFTDQEVRVCRKDTGKCWIFSYSGTPVATKEGEPILSVLTLRDISARVAAEEALRLSQNKFATIFRAVPALLVISIVRSGTVLDVNDTALQSLGYQRDEIVGHTVHEVRLWEDPEDRAKVLQILESRGSVQNVEIRFHKKSGHILTGLLSAETIELNGERCLIILVKDITDRKRIEEEVARLNQDLAARAAELEAANRELEAFSYSVAHDLRRPLNVINGYCQTMEAACGDRLGHDCRGYLDEAYQATLRMNDLISALLNFSKLARTQPKRREVDLSDLAGQLAKELQRTGGERRASFIIAEGMTASADFDLMRVVLENLIGNAWKFTGRKEEAVIEIGKVQGAERATFFVRDNGEGFDMADAGKLFLPFQRLASPEEFTGSGIGLATVERVIHRHGGTVWAEGKPGAGATFYFTVGE